MKVSTSAMIIRDTKSTIKMIEHHPIGFFSATNRGSGASGAEGIGASTGA